MLSLPFPSPDTVTIATLVFQTGKSVWRGTEVPFWKERGGVSSLRSCFLVVVLPQGRKQLCDNHLVNLALQWAARPLGVGISFVQPQNVCVCVCMYYKYICILYNVAFLPRFVCVCIHSIGLSVTHCAVLRTWYPGPGISHKIRFRLISIFKPNENAVLSLEAHCLFNTPTSGGFSSLPDCFWFCKSACFEGVSVIVFNFVNPNLVMVWVSLGFVWPRAALLVLRPPWGSCVIRFRPQICTLGYAPLKDR